MEIPGFSCGPGKIKKVAVNAEELTYEGKYNITLPEAKYSCSKDMNCAQFYTLETYLTTYYYKCPIVSHRLSDNNNGILYVKGIEIAYQLMLKLENRVLISIVYYL